jgi:hypothetical protein
MIQDHQSADGSWITESSGFPGSPVTYGRTLATAIARQVLARAGKERFAGALRRAEAWLLAQHPEGVLEAAGQLIGLSSLEGEPAGEATRLGLEILGRGQGREGGWGPYVHSPPEVFDTALSLLALVPHRRLPGVPDRIRRGREYLIRTQSPDGSWPETTRPSGAESYAQRISTSAWAAIALMVSRIP